MNITLLKELDKLHYTKKAYFMWKHGLSNKITDYSQFTREEIINKAFNGEEIKLQRMKNWEKTEEYSKLVYLMLKERYPQDFTEIYEIVLQSAKKGDDKSIKTLLMLQKELKVSLNYLTKCKSEIEEDDLILS